MHSLLDLKLADTIDDERRVAAAAQGQRSARLAAAARKNPLPGSSRTTSLR
jgi:hypothetical protein